MACRAQWVVLAALMLAALMARTLL